MPKTTARSHLRPLPTSTGRSPSSSQSQRRADLLDAARVLGNKGGYEAVTIDAICRLANVARGTVYNYFSSKDHLLMAAVVQWAEECTSAIHSNPPEGATLQDRIVGALGFVADRVMREPKFFRAGFQALSSPTPATAPLQERLLHLTAEYLEPALNSASEIDPGPLCMVLGHVTYASLTGMIAGRLSPERFIQDLTVVTRMALESSDVRRFRSDEEQRERAERSPKVRTYRVRRIRVTEHPSGGPNQSHAADHSQEVDIELFVDITSAAARTLPEDADDRSDVE